MTERKPDVDLDAYLPDEAALKASRDRKVEYSAEIDPGLVQRLRAVRTTVNGRPAPRPASTKPYGPPPPLGSSRSEHPPVASEVLAARIDPRHAPTQPSLRRVARTRAKRVALVGLGALIAFTLVLWRAQPEPAQVVEAAPPPPLTVLRPEPVGDAPAAPEAAATTPLTSPQLHHAGSSAAQVLRPPKPERRATETETRPASRPSAPLPSAKPVAID